MEFSVALKKDLISESKIPSQNLSSQTMVSILFKDLLKL